MANNFDPELIGILLMVLRRHSSPTRNRDYWPYLLWSNSTDERLDSQSQAIPRHLEFMANLGLIKKRRQELALKNGELSLSASLNQWQLCSEEEFGDRFPSPDLELGNRPIRSNSNDDGNGHYVGVGNGGGGNGGNDGVGGQGDDGQSSGRGIGEVLSHPVLFSLPDAEFVALIDNLFEGSGAP